MYHWIQDKDYLNRAYRACANLTNQLLQELKKEGFDAKISIVGSKSRNMVTQNNKEKIDFDFNLEIFDAPNIKNCMQLKETVRKTFNHVLNKNMSREEIQQVSDDIKEDLGKSINSLTA